MSAARRYADALADLAVERGLVAQLGEELRSLSEMFSENRELYDMFASPIVSLAEKQKVLQAIVERIQPGPIVRNLLSLLLRHQRLHEITAVSDQFRRTMNERQGIVLAEVTTAMPVDEQERQMLRSRLEQMTGGTVEIRFQTDASLIGGAVTRIGSVVYDGSIRTRLQSIKEALKQGGGTKR